MRKDIILFLLTVWLTTTIFFLITWRHYKEILLENLNAYISPNTTHTKLPTLEETRQRVEREKQEQINRLVLELNISPQEAQQILYPTQTQQQEIIKSMQHEIATIAKIVTQNTQQPSQQEREGRFVNVDGEFKNTDQSTASIEKFAECLSTKELKIYWTQWCWHCKNQKTLFWKSFEKIRYIDCDTQRQECLDAWVRWFPTWIDKQWNKYPGTQQLEKLSEITWCPEP